MPVPGAAEYGWNIDSWQGAVDLDRHLMVLMAGPPTPESRTVVVIGGGMTGIEFAAEARSRIAAHSDAETAAEMRIVLVEQADRIGPEFGENPRPVIEEALNRTGVEVLLGRSVARIDADAVTLDDGTAIETATAVVTVGMRASPLTEKITGERDALGRLVVDDTRAVIGVSGVYATGDAAHARVDDAGHVALMSCQHARTMGKYAGYNAARDLMGLPPRLYRQPVYTTTLDLGSYGALYTTGWDRKVEQSGLEVKARKQMINTRWIYPPTGSADEVFAGLRIDENGR